MDAEQIESWDASYRDAHNVHRTDDDVDLYYEYRGEGPWLTILSSVFARDFAVRYPDRVKGLILCGPAISAYQSIRRNLHLKAWLAALEAGGPAGLFDASYPFVLGDATIGRGGRPAYLALRNRFLAVHSKAQLRENLEGGLQATDSPEKLRDLKCPVLLFTGDDDFNVGRAGLEDQAELIPDARVEIIPRCGHAPYVEQTDAFQSLVGGFVAEVEARESSLASREG